MRNIFISLLLLSLTLTFLASDSATAAKKKNSKIAKATKLARPDFKMKKLKKDEVPKISLRQLAYMTDNERTLYFKAYREAMMGMEKVQRVFDYDVVNRSKVTAYQPPKKKSFFARLFGFGDSDDSRMPASEGQHGRGSNCDSCIFAYNLSNYGPQCRRFPFGCDPPASCNNGRGISCDPVISGVQGSRACINRTDSIRSTRTCDDVRQGLVDRNGTQIGNAIQAAKDYFELDQGIDHAIANLDAAKLSDPRAQQILDNLWDVAYSDSARGDFFVIAEIYKRRGVTMPDVSIVNANGQNQNVNISNLNIYNIQEDANGLTLEFFSQHRNLCNQELASDVVQEILDGRHIPSDRQISGASNASERQTLINRKLQEEQRQTAARELRQRNSRARLTVRNVLQVEECRLVDAMYDRLSSRVRQAYLRMPVPPRTPQSHVVSQGCPTSPDADLDLIYQQTAVCTMCSVERSVINNEGQGNPDFTHVTSRKWQSLISTMALTCDGMPTLGDGDDGMYLTAPAMRRVIETFGHCSADTYDWNMDVDASYINRHPQHGSIQEWSGRSQIDTKRRGNYAPDRNNAFRNVYGISYEDAEEFFCDVLKGNKSLDQAIERARRDAYRSRGSVSTAAAPLLACMEESRNRVNTIYSAAAARNGARNCTRSAGIRQGYPSFYQAAISSDAPGMVMHNNEDCLVTKQIEYLPGENDPTVALVVPQQAGVNSTEQYTTYAAALQAGATRPQMSCSAAGQQTCSYAEESSNMQVTYPVACTGGGTNQRSDRRRANQ